MIKARAAVDASSKMYFKILKEGVEKFKTVKEKFPGLNFWQWAEKNYQELALADNARKEAEKELISAIDVYYGPHAAALATYLDNIGNALSSDPSPG
jgi:hypothetical protein